MPNKYDDSTRNLQLIYSKQRRINTITSWLKVNKHFGQQNSVNNCYNDEKVAVGSGISL